MPVKPPLTFGHLRIVTRAFPYSHTHTRSLVQPLSSARISFFIMPIPHYTHLNHNMSLTSLSHTHRLPNELQQTDTCQSRQAKRTSPLACIDTSLHTSQSQPVTHISKPHPLSYKRTTTNWHLSIKSSQAHITSRPLVHHRLINQHCVTRARPRVGNRDLCLHKQQLRNH